MSFCGTSEHEHRWKMLGFAMHCSSLSSRLLKLKYGPIMCDDNGQTQLFQMTIKDREDFAKFAKNLRWLIADHKAEGLGFADSYWQGYREYEYTDYEFLKLLERFADKVASVAVLLEKVANGEQLTEEESKEARGFLHTLQGHANAAMDDMRGGCF